MIFPALISSQRCSHLKPSSKIEGIWEKISACGPSRAELGPCHQGEVPLSLAAFIQLFHLNELLHLLFQHERNRGEKKKKKSNGPGAFCALRGCLSSFGLQEK